MITNFQPTEYSALQQRLLDALEQYPQDWVFTPLKEDKRPYRKNWQTEPPLSRAAITQEIISGRAKGIGLRTGPISGGILAVDFDGSSSVPLFIEKFGEIPLTQGFSSLCVASWHLPERFQLVFDVPQDFWHAMKNRLVFKTGVQGEQLELRWAGSQSVLPGSVHPKTGCYHWLPGRSPAECPSRAIAPDSLIEALLVDPVEQTQPKIPYQPQQQERWTEVDWALSYLAALSPARADNYDDWLAVGMALRSASESLLSDWDNWSQQSAKYKPGECDRKWKSFKHSGVGIGTVAHMAKQDGWRSPFEKPTGSGYSGGFSGFKRQGLGGNGSGGGDGEDGSSGKVLLHPSATFLTSDELLQRVDELITQGITGSKLTSLLNKLATEARYPLNEVRKLFYERLEEVERDETKSDRTVEVDQFVSLSDSKGLSLIDFLPEALAKPLTQWCSWLNLKPETALTALLTTTSSLHHVGTELVIHRAQDFCVPPIIFAALVSESGQKKSPLFRTIARKPLGTLHKEVMDRYKEVLAQYEQDKENYDGQGPKPTPPPRPPIYYFTDANGEGIKSQAAECPQKALFALVDEISGLFNSDNRYRSGRGSDRQDMLSYFDGLGATVLRAGGIKHDVDQIYLSMFGTIQSEVLKRHMADCNDPDGKWARFLFVNQPLAPATLSDDGFSVNVTETLTAFYRWLSQVPEMEYHLSRDAFKRYQKAYNKLEQLRCSHPKAGMRAVYSKAEGYIGRLAQNLHVIDCWASGQQTPDAEISLSVIERAIALADFYIDQVKLIHFHSDEIELSPKIVRLIELSKRFEESGRDGWVKARDIQLNTSGKQRPTSDAARSLMREADALGRGQCRGTGVHLEYHWRNPDSKNVDAKTPINTLPQENVDAETPIPPLVQGNVDKVDDFVDDFVDAETTVYQENHHFVDFVDNFPTFSAAVLEKDPIPELEKKLGKSSTKSTKSTKSCNAHCTDVLAVDDFVDNPSTFPESVIASPPKTDVMAVDDFVDSSSTKSDPVIASPPKEEWVRVAMPAGATLVRVISRSGSRICCHVPGIGTRHFKESDIVEASDVCT